MVGLYFTGILVGILFALISKNSVFKGEAVPFVMELPNYRLPGAKNVTLSLWDKAKDFLQRAFSVIFVATIVIWFLQSFDPQFNIVSDSQNSMLAIVAGWIAPVFAPLGFGDWRISTALISGFMAKESVVATLSVLFGSTSTLLSATTPLAAGFFAGILPAVYALRGRCGSNQAGTGREMGRVRCVLCHRMGLCNGCPFHRIIVCGGRCCSMMVSVLIAIMIAVYTGKVIFLMVKNRKKTCSDCSGCPFSGKCRYIKQRPISPKGSRFIPNGSKQV